MRPVTDSAILSALEGGGPKPVTDANLIAQLEGAPVPIGQRGLGQRLAQVPFALPGVAETALQMGTGFIGAVPAALAGVHRAISTGDVNEYPGAFSAVQEALTYAPRTQVGKELTGGVGDVFHAYSSNVVDPIADATPGGPLAQTAVKTIGEAIPLVAPFGVSPAIRAMRRKPVDQPVGPKPVTDPALVAELERQSAQPEALAPDQPPMMGQPARSPEIATLENAPKIGDPAQVRPQPMPPVRPDVLPRDLGGIVADMEKQVAFRQGLTPDQARDALMALPDAELWEAAARAPGMSGPHADLVVSALRGEPATVRQGQPFEGRAIPAEFALERPTEAGLRERAQQLDAAQFAEREATQGREQQAAADRQVGDFELSGSDRAADFTPRQGELRPVTDPAIVEALESNVVEINVRERKRKPPKLDAQNDSITTAIAKLGGLRSDFMQDVSAVGKGSHRDVRGGAYLSKKNGRTADEMAEMLHEEGYLADRSDIQGMFNKLDEELRAGEPTHFSIRQNVDAYMEKLMERKYGPQGEGGGGTLYSGIPLDKAGDTIKAATRKLGDALGVPEKGVEVYTKPPHPRAMSILDQFRSPSELVNKYPTLKSYVERAQRAQVEMDTLRDAFGRRLQYVDNALGGRILEKAPDLGANYRANKRALNEILLEGDMLGKRFSEAELRQRGTPDNIIKAYESIRSAYDHALGIANQTRALRGKEAVSKREGYIPHFFHDFFIKIDGEIIGSARTLREAVSMANDAARAGAGEVTVTPKGMRFPGEQTQAAIVGDATYFKLREAMEEAFSMTTEQASGLLSDIARMRGRSRVVGNFLERKGAPGWEKNLDFAHRHYFNMISRYSALDKFKSSTQSAFEMRFGAFDKEYSGLPKYIKDYINDINGVPTRAEQLLDSAVTNTPGLKQLAQQFLGDRPSLEIATATTNAVAIAKLGLYNVSAALVNLTQMNMAQSVLGARWFAEGAKKAAAVELELGRRKLGMSGGANMDIGILRQLDVPIQQGLENNGFSNSSQMGRVFRTSTMFFNNVEFANRATTSLGAYYKALSEGKGKAQALEYAREVNKRVNFDYSLADAPNFIRRAGPAGQVMFQFKKFPIKAMEFMANLKGAEQARFWIPFVLVSGYYAFPGMEAIKNMVKGMFDIDIELESKDYLIRWAGDDPEKKAIAKTIFYGAFSHDALGGIDISRRVGGGDFIPSEVGDLFGPFFSSTVRATQMAAEENWAEALRAIATAPGNIAIALRNDGEITSPWDRDRLTTKLDTKGRILKSLGFSTAQESRERDTARVMRYNERQQREAETEAIDGYIHAYTRSDQAAIDRAMDRFAELGMGAGLSKRIAEEMQKKGMTVSERAFDNLGKRGKARQFPILEHAR